MNCTSSTCECHKLASKQYMEMSLPKEEAILAPIHASDIQDQIVSRVINKRNLYIHYRRRAHLSSNHSSKFSNIRCFIIYNGAVKTRPLLLIFVLFSTQRQISKKMTIDRIQTMDSRMVGADESTELWRPQAFIKIRPFPPSFSLFSLFNTTYS